MSQRTFFGERNTLPGLTFILVILLVNAQVIFIILKKDPYLVTEIDALTGVVLSVSTVLGSTSIGFCISQFWYFIWGFIYEFIFYRSNYFPVRTLRDNFPDAQNPRTFYLIFNYLSGNLIELKGHIERRQDLFNLFGSSFFSVLFGLKIGLSLKNYIITELCITRSPIYEVLTIIFSISLLCFFIVGIMRVLNHMFHITIAEFLGNRPWYQWKLERYIAEENNIHIHRDNCLWNSILYGVQGIITVCIIGSIISFIFRLFQIIYAHCFIPL